MGSVRGGHRRHAVPSRGPTLITTLLLLGLTQAAPAANAVPPAAPAIIASDVASVADAFAAVAIAAKANPPDAAPLEAALLKALVRGCDQALLEAGLRDVLPADRKVLDRAASELVAQRAAAALGTDLRDRRAALDDLARRVTTRALATSLVDRWLGFAGDLERRAGSPVVANVENPLAPPVGLAAQLTISSRVGADLRADPAKARVLEDLGGPGAGNGVIDAGEWVRVEFALTNTSQRPWFSSTLFVHADTCIWAPEVGTELPELAAGTTATASTWLYVSGECSGPHRFKLGIRDSLRAPSTEEELLASITPVEVGVPRAINVRLDTDELGSSDGSQRRAIGPGLRFEHSMDLAGLSELSKVRTTYSSPPDLKPLFAVFTNRDEPLRRDSERIYRAADDLDATTVARNRFNQALEDARASRRWVVERTPGLIWLALDVDMEVARPAATASAQPEPAAPRPPRPPSEAEVVALVRRNLALAPHPVKPELPDATAAATGYEIVFDSARFAEAYRALTLPPATKVETPAPPQLAYRHRLYVSLALESAAPKPSPPPPAPAPAPPPPPAAPPPPEAAEPQQLRLDLSAGRLALGRGSAGPTDVGATAFRMRLWRDGLPAFFGGVDYAKDDRMAFTELTARAGLAAELKVAPAVTLAPWAAGLVCRTESSFDLPYVSAALELGATVRIRLLDSLSLLGEGSARLGPSAFASDGRGFYFGAGLSFAFGGGASPSASTVRVAPPAPTASIPAPSGELANPAQPAAPPPPLPPAPSAPPAPRVAAEPVVEAPAPAARPAGSAMAEVRIRRGAELRAAPDPASPVKAVVAEEERGEAVIKPLHGFRYVKTAGGLKGWARESDLR